jgi:hypothetical protein
MEYRHATPHEAEGQEIVLNLWAYSDEDGYIMRLAGKAYVMAGNDDNKLWLLRQLSATDFLSAPWFPVSKNFKLVRPDGEEMTGVANASMLSEPTSHEVLFSPVMDELAEALPEQVCMTENGYEKFKMKLTKSPLCVTTVVMEFEDGRLVPMVSGR